jgi:hypothetical protein
MDGNVALVQERLRSLKETSLQPQKAQNEFFSRPNVA